MEKKLNSSELVRENRYCGVHLIINLPVGAEKEFEKLSKFELPHPQGVGIPTSQTQLAQEHNAQE